MVMAHWKQRPLRTMVLEDWWRHNPRPSLRRAFRLQKGGILIFVAAISAPLRRSFQVPARPYPRNGHAVGDANMPIIVRILKRAFCLQKGGVLETFVAAIERASAGA